MNIKAWLHAIRIRTLPLAISSVGLGSFLAAYDHAFRWSVFILASLTTLFLQVLSNLANDYGDYLHGADNEFRKGPQRAVAGGKISPGAMKAGIIVTVISAFFTGLFLLMEVFTSLSGEFIFFLITGIAAILAALGYTLGKKPYGYAGLGDVFVILFFGLAGVMGTYFLHTLRFNLVHLLPAISSGLFAAAVLNINNLRDIESDRLAGKKSIPVRIGKEKAVIYHWFLIAGGFFAALLFTIIQYKGPFQLLFLLTGPFFLKNGMDVSKNTDPEKLDPSLKKMALATLLFVLTFGLGLLL